MVELASIRTFVEVVDAGSFSECARRRSVAISSVARHISLLEQELGVRLINRNTRRHSLTEAGSIYYEHAREVLHQLDLGNRRVSAFGSGHAGRLRLSLQPIAADIILRVLHVFLRQHPDITVDIGLHDGRPDLIRNQIELAVWLGSAPDSRLIFKKLTTSRRILVASPDYFARHGRPSAPEDLKGHDCIVFNAPTYDGHWRFSREGRHHDILVDGTVSSDSGQVLKQLAVTGVGIAVLQEFMVLSELKEGTLETALTEYEISTTDAEIALYAFYQHRLSLTPKARLFLDFLTDLFAPIGPAARAKPASPPDHGEAS